MKINCVVGANFGDEGKGLFTDYFTRADSVVVRFNGGAQAGHTVTRDDGKRHVFSHFGAGTMKGARTFLSDYFVVNPALFAKEKYQLETMGYSPRISVDGRCYVTTPYDMLINQTVENHRADGRHGSCGVGFGETIERSEREYDSRFILSVSDLMNDRIVRDKLVAIASEYTPERLYRLGIFMTPFVKQILDSPHVIDNYLADCERFIKNVNICDLSEMKTSHLVFEGAQGLLLDQSADYWPHVTRSNTGIKNVMSLIENLSVSELNILYASRSYLTRHGAGRINQELESRPTTKVVDLTNFRNAYQGSLRFAYLDVDGLDKSINTDLLNLNGMHANVSLGISCIDQLDEYGFVHHDGDLHKVPSYYFSSWLFDKVNVNGLYESTGPTRNHIAKLL